MGPVSYFGHHHVPRPHAAPHSLSLSLSLSQSLCVTFCPVPCSTLRLSAAGPIFLFVFASSLIMYYRQKSSCTRVRTVRQLHAPPQPYLEHYPSTNPYNIPRTRSTFTTHQLPRPYAKPPTLTTTPAHHTPAHTALEAARPARAARRALPPTRRRVGTRRPSRPPRGAGSTRAPRAPF